MRSTNRLCFFLIVCMMIIVVPIACAPNAGKDGSAGAAGADGQDTTGGSGSAPQSPSGLTAEAQSPSRIDVRWIFNTGAELGFNVQRSETEGEWETIAGTAANVTVYQDESAECEHTYSYRVLAYNDYGESAPSSAADATADFCELDTPSDLTAILDEEHDDGAQRAVLLSWSEGAGQLPGVPASYEIYRKTFDASWSDTPLATQPSDQTTYTDEDAACDGTYQYRIRAANENDVKSAFSNVSTSRSDACPLIDPSNITATTDQAGSIDLAWDINDPDATGYLLQRREYEARAEWITIVDLPEGSTSYSDEGATCEMAQYDYRLRAYNGDKQSAWVETLTPGSAFCVVDAPSSLYANVIGSNEIELTWRSNADNATGIRIYRNEAELTTLAPDASSYSDTTVDCQTLYRYEVTAYTSNVESDFSNSEAAQSDYCPISAPFNVATAGDGNEVTVSWEHDLHYATSFDVHRRIEGEGAWQLLETVAAPDLNVTDTTVECYTSYEYRVVAYNSNVESAWSDSATGAATGCTPTRPQPVLSTSSPVSYIAFSREGEDEPKYPLTLSGEGIASDTQVEIGDFLFDCDTGGFGTSCQADGSGGIVPDTCATNCTTSIPNEIMRNAGTYVVRLVTPDPVYNGLNTSDATKFFNVIAPLPEFSKIWPRGVMQLLDDSSQPIAQEIAIKIWGRNVMDNAFVRLGVNSGIISDKSEDAVTGDQIITALISTAGLTPRDNSYDFSIANPSPGGGEQIKAFGVNPLAEDWDGAQATNMRGTRAGGTNPQVWHRISGPSLMPTNTGLQYSGGTQWVALRDNNGRMLKRIAASNLGSAIPYEVGEQIDFQTTSGIGSPASLTNPTQLYRGGDGTFGAQSDFGMGDQPMLVALVDLNGDGVPDIVTANSGNTFTYVGAVSISLGNGDGTFGTPTILSNGGDFSSTLSVAVVDINGDGAPDLIAANMFSNDVSIRFGNGDGTFAAKTDLPMGTMPQSVAAADLNGDGAPDLISANSNSNDVSVRLGNGDGTFGGNADLPMGTFPSFIAAGDLNGDGAPDLISANNGSDDVSIRLGIGDGTFDAHTDLAMGTSPNSIAIADLNGDGAPDLVTANRESDDVSIRLGNGDGAFGEKTDLSMGDQTYSVAAADLNGDGAPDLVSANWNSNGVSIRLGNGDGTFGAQADLAMGGGTDSVAVADLDGDGTPDLVTSNQVGGSVSIRLGNSGDTFSAITYLPMGSQPKSLATADLNDDGAPDMVTANYGSNNISIRINDGTGAFGSKTDLPTGTGPYAVAVAKFDNNNTPDIVTANLESNDISIHLGNSDGSFGASSDLPMGDNPRWLTVADLNVDDIADIIAWDYNGTNVSMRLGFGDGTFDERVALSLGDNPIWVTAADLNGDDTPDLATVDKNSDDVSIRLGNGDGTFGAQNDFAMGEGPSSVIAADLDGDDVQDLITANSQSDDVSVRLGNGDGTFGARTDLAMGDSTQIVAAIDVDVDGILDLVSLSSTTSCLVSIRMGNGDGTFGSRTDRPIGVGLNPVIDANVVVDIDDDGRKDLLSVIRWTDNVTIRSMDIPGTWRQDLTDSFSDDPDQPWLPKYAENGFTEIDIHQAAQIVTKVGVRVFLEWTTQPVGTIELGLVAPDGQMVDLGSYNDFTPWPNAESPTSWRLNKTIREYDFNGETGIADLVGLHGLQPTDYWTLSIDNQTAASAEVKNFTVITDGYF
jgi:fibronectin type 3 domain-containing protein